MLEALMRVARGRTTIIVSHALGISTLAERVVVLDGGRIVEEGRPGELLTRGGAYAELWSSRRGPHALHVPEHNSSRKWKEVTTHDLFAAGNASQEAAEAPPSARQVER